MKDAAKCAMQCDLQTSVNHWIFERIRRRLTSGGRSVSASFFRLLQVVCVRWGFALGASDDYPFRAMRGALASANFLHGLGALNPPTSLFCVGGGFFAFGASATFYPILDLMSVLRTR